MSNIVIAGNAITAGAGGPSIGIAYSTMDAGNIRIENNMITVADPAPGGNGGLGGISAETYEY